MQYSGSWSGSAPIIKKYKASATGLVPGVIVMSQVDGSSGQMIVSTTTSVADTIGLLLDNGEWKNGTAITYSTTQGAEEAVFSVIVSPDAILRAQMVMGATGTSMTADTIVTSASNGLTAVGGTSVASPDMDQGLLWYLTGANAGRSRTITSTSSVTATVIVPFAANAVGDTYCYTGVNLCHQGVTTTTDLKSIRADIANSTGAALSVWDVELNGTTNSYVQLTYGDSIWTQTT